MSEMYHHTANLWRGPEEMGVVLINLGVTLQAFFATSIFMHGYKGGGWREGLRFGVLITLFLLGLGLITYATQPIPLKIIAMWVLADLISYSIGGILLSLVACKFVRCSKTTVDSKEKDTQD